MPPEKFDVGIGINTGEARLGNVGSIHKFKYGVLGNTVNVGSRLQTATKHVGARCLVSKSTIDRDRSDGPKRNVRRLADLRVAGIQRPYTVYEATRESGPEWERFVETYHSALSHFHQVNLARATEEFGKALQLRPNDRASMLHLSKILEHLTQPRDEFETFLTIPK